jgi:hypothetical protein
MFTQDELEILKSALAGDIIKQKDYLDKCKVKDKPFEDWLNESKKLHRKVSSLLFDMKVKNIDVSVEPDRVKRGQEIFDLAQKNNWKPGKIN